MHWGYKILIAYLVFILFLGVLVYRSFQSDINLVTEEYYQKEIAYQEQIDKLKNEQSLKETIRIYLHASDGTININFPSAMRTAQGQVVLYRPSDSDLDTRRSLQLDAYGTQQVATENLEKGLWKVQVEWQVDGIAYFKEQNLYIP